MEHRVLYITGYSKEKHCRVSINADEITSVGNSEIHGIHTLNAYLEATKLEPVKRITSQGTTVIEPVMVATNYFNYFFDGTDWTEKFLGPLILLSDEEDDDEYTLDTSLIVSGMSALISAINSVFASDPSKMDPELKSALINYLSK